MKLGSLPVKVKCKINKIDICADTQYKIKCISYQPGYKRFWIHIKQTLSSVFQDLRQKDWGVEYVQNNIKLHGMLLPVFQMKKKMDQLQFTVQPWYESINEVSFLSYTQCSRLKCTLSTWGIMSRVLSSQSHSKPTTMMSTWWTDDDDGKTCGWTSQKPHLKNHLVALFHLTSASDSCGTEKDQACYTTQCQTWSYYTARLLL